MSEADEPIADLVARLRGDPLVQRFVHDGLEHGRRTGHAPPVRTPRAVIGEQRSLALSVLVGAVPVRVVDTSRAADRALAHAIGRLIAHAVPVLWLNEIQHVAFAHNLPRHIVGDVHLPHRVMWWTFEGSLPSINAETGEELGDVTDSVLVVERASEITFALTRSAWEQGSATSGRSGLLDVVSVAKGSRYPQDFVGGRGRLGQYLQAIAFMNSPYVELRREQTHKPGAKAKWHGRRIGDPQSIAVIRLRSSVQEAVDVERGSGPQWKQRWLVRGHYRAQWYPSEKAHRVIWIAPYIKGPDDAPLKAPVYAVTR